MELMRTMQPSVPERNKPCCERNFRLEKTKYHMVETKNKTQPEKHANV